MRTTIALCIILGTTMLGLYVATGQDTNNVVMFNPSPHPASITIASSGSVYVPAGSETPSDPLLAPVVSVLKAAHLSDTTISKITSVLALIGALKLIMHGLAVRFAKAMSDKLAWHTEQVGSDHDVYVREMLVWKPYRFAAAFFDIVLSVQLPTLATYEAQIAAQKTPPGGTALPANLKSQ